MGDERDKEFFSMTLVPVETKVGNGYRYW